jgi:LmeA-like phospholipid-binding
MCSAGCWWDDAVRPGKLTVIVLIVLAVLALVADRGGQLAAERVVAGRIKTTLSSSARPNVDLGGFPFLTELVRGKLRHVVVDVTDADGGKVQIARLHADLHGVTRQGDGIHAEQISGDGLITYDALTDAAKPLHVDFGGPGLVRITAEVTVLGRELTASASGRPSIEGETLLIKPEQVNSSETGDAAIAARQVPQIRVPLRDVPPNLNITLDPEADGVHFSFSGSNVQLSGKDHSAAAALPAARPRRPAVPLSA